MRLSVLSTTTLLTPNGMTMNAIGLGTTAAFARPACLTGSPVLVNAVAPSQLLGDSVPVTVAREKLAHFGRVVVEREQLVDVVGEPGERSRRSADLGKPSPNRLRQHIYVTVTK